MRSLIRLVSLRHLAHEPIKVLLSLLGVAIGVAVFVSIRLSNQTALSSFTSTLDAVAGRANFQIVANDEGGFSESVYRTIRSLKSGAVFTPVVESVPVILSSNRPLIVLGVDIFSDAKFRTYTPQEVPQNRSEGFLGELLKPNSIIISSSIAMDYGLRIGDTLGLRSRGTPVRLIVRSFLKLDGPAQAMGGNFAVMDIASAQEAFGKTGKLDRIDVLLPEDERRDEVLEGMRQALPANVTITRPQNRTEQTVKMLAAFSLNLTALAFIATFVAMFLIYNTILTSALRRRKEIGTLRSFGAKGSHIFLMFIIEALLIGVVGSLVGVVLGILLAEGTRSQVLQTVSALWLQVAANSTHVTPSILIQGFVLGLMTTFLAAAFPAYEAMRTPIRETFSTATLEERFSINFKKLFAVCLAILVAAGASSMAPAVGRMPLFGFLAAILLLIGAAFLTPVFVLFLVSVIRPVIGKLFGIEGSLASEYLAQSLRRSSIAIAALMVAFAMLIGVDTMISSFRTTVELWIGQTMKSDIYVGLRANMNSAGNQTPLADEVVRYIRALPEVQSVDTFRGIRIRYNGEQTTLASVDIVAANTASRLQMRRGNTDTIIKDARNGRGVLVTESFALRHQLGENDSLSLMTPKGVQSFLLLGVYYDYSTDGGMILMDKSSFIPLWNDSSVSNIAIELQNDTMLPVVKERIERDLAAPHGIIAFSNNDLRQQVLTIFDQTFAITYALEAIAIIVAVIGIINALLMMIVEREREIGILKAVGASNWQVRKMVIVNGGLIGACAAVIGSVTGLFLSLILVFVINRQSFGWSIQYHPNIATIVSVSAVLIITAMLSALWPAFLASRKLVKASLRYE